MKIRELIQKLEGEKNALQEENKVLREKVDKLSIEIYLLKGKLDSKENIILSEEKPKVDVIENQLTYVEADVDGKHYVDIVEGKCVSIDDVVNKESKPKRSRKKKVEETPIFVEPVKEPENA